jgi:hypothetical protein
MSSPRRIVLVIERLQAGLILLVLVGTTLAFGGAVWWARPALAAIVSLLCLTSVVRATFSGSFTILKSPLTLLGGLAVLLAAFQLAPLPAGLAQRLSPRSRAAYALGALPDRVLADDPSAALPEAGTSRTPVSVDRPATLRWLGGAACCLALFVAVAHGTDRLGHAMAVWGGVVGSLFLCTTFGAAQLLGATDGLYGSIEPGQGAAWGPSMVNLIESPNQVALRSLGDPVTGDPSWGVLKPDHPGAVAGLMGGPGAFLALGSLGLPLALGIVLQMLAPRGARESLRERLRANGKAGLAGLLFALLLVSSLLIGVQGGRILGMTFAVGLLLAGLPPARASGLRGVAVAATALALLALAAGVWLGESLGRLPGGSPLASASGWSATRAVWVEAIRIARDFPLLGAGLGSFSGIHPYYKTTDAAPNTALSSLLQWWAETGLAGMAVLGLALSWVIVRLPGAIRRVGTADRCLAFGLVGSMVSFAAFSAVHWTIELAAVALAASAVAGTCHRWLAGGTDLFIERA